jgi:phage-related minor tail protein
MAQGMESQFSGIFMDTFKGSLKSLSDYFNNFADLIAASFSRAMANMLTEWIQTQARMKTEGGLMNTIGKWIGGALGGGGTPYITENAKGNVFDGPRLFRFSQGVGMLGEAGPEGILPLKRTSRGDLGVQVAGDGGSGNVQVQIINESGQRMAVTKSAAKLDGQALVVTAWLDAYNRNSYGLRTAMGR